MVKNQEQEKAVLVSGNFGDKERTASSDAYVQYDENAKEFVVVNESQGNQIDEARLLTYVSQTLDDAIFKDPLGGDVEITLGTEVYRQPIKADSETIQTKLKDLNGQLENIPERFGYLTPSGNPRRSSDRM